MSRRRSRGGGCGRESPAGRPGRAGISDRAAALEPLADLISEMEGVAQDGKGQIPLLQQFCQLPELGMQDGVAAGDVEVGQTPRLLAEGLTVFNDLDHIVKGHLFELGVAAQGVDIAVLAPLVASLGNVPLKRKVFHDRFLLGMFE